MISYIIRPKSKGNLFYVTFDYKEIKSQKHTQIYLHFKWLVDALD